MRPKCVAKRSRIFNAVFAETVMDFATHFSTEAQLLALESKQPCVSEPAPTKPVKPSASFAGSLDAQQWERR